MELTEAVNTAVEECIRADILKEFLIEQKAEVIAMSIYEYNEEYVRKSLFEEGAAHKLVQNIESVMAKLGISLEKACEILDTTVEEYENAKKY